jgi:hypothetical protein
MLDLPDARKLCGPTQWLSSSIPLSYHIRNVPVFSTIETTSARLRAWCERNRNRNRNRCHIPEWLLDAWKIPVDPNFT